MTPEEKLMRILNTPITKEQAEHIGQAIIASRTQHLFVFKYRIFINGEPYALTTPSKEESYEEALDRVCGFAELGENVGNVVNINGRIVILGNLERFIEYCEKDYATITEDPI